MPKGVLQRRIEDIPWFSVCCCLHENLFANSATVNRVFGRWDVFRRWREEERTWKDRPFTVDRSLAWGGRTAYDSKGAALTGSSAQTLAQFSGKSASLSSANMCALL